MQSYEVVLLPEAKKTLHDLQHSFLRRRYPGLGQHLIEVLEEFGDDPHSFRNRRFVGKYGSYWCGEIFTKFEHWLIFWREEPNNVIVIMAFADATELNM
jgi:hypothetical protein